MILLVVLRAHHTGHVSWFCAGGDPGKSLGGIIEVACAELSAFFLTVIRRGIHRFYIVRQLLPHNSRAKSGLTGVGKVELAAKISGKKFDMIRCPTTTTHASILLANQPSPTTATATSPSLRRKKVLIADDDCIFLKALSMKLINNGYEVITSRDGAGAVSMARTSKPDLILLDINFPPDLTKGDGVSWDGLVIMDCLRRSEETRTTPIIVITGENPKLYREPSLAAGAVAFFHKPIRPDHLLPVIRRVLGEDPD